MTPRDTRTGQVLEEMVLPALRRGGYECSGQVLIGLRPGGRRHKVDVLARDAEGRTFAISLKWQQVSGTAEQKVPFEIMCLAQAVIRGDCTQAYIVLGGNGWTLREFYLSGELAEHLCHADKVRVVGLEEFIAIANQGRL